MRIGMILVFSKMAGHGMTARLVEKPVPRTHVLERVSFDSATLGSIDLFLDGLVLEGFFLSTKRHVSEAFDVFMLLHGRAESP